MLAPGIWRRSFHLTSLCGRFRRKRAIDGRGNGGDPSLRPNLLLGLRVNALANGAEVVHLTWVPPFFAPELSLAIACCRWPTTDNRNEELRALASNVKDWQLVERIIQRHRITPLASHNLLGARADVPPSVQHSLARRARESAVRSLAQAREVVRLQREFDRAGIPVLTVKGTPMALLAYGQIGMKESWDIDLLTSPGHLQAAIRLLLDCGYRNSLAHLDQKQFEAYLLVSKEAQFTDSTTGITVELHWRLIDSARLLRGICAEGPAQDVQTPVGPLRTMPDQVLFAYLSLHGAFHSWARLKWLADLGGWLSHYDEMGRQRLYQAAQRHGAGRAAAVALMLCNQLLDLELSDRLLCSLRERAVHRFLTGNVLKCLAHGAGAAEHEAYTMPWLRATAAQFVIVPGPAHLRETTRRLIWSPAVDRRQTPIPSELAFLYPLLRVPLWAIRVGKRVLRRQRRSRLDGSHPNVE